MMFLPHFTFKIIQNDNETVHNSLDNAMHKMLFPLSQFIPTAEAWPGDTVTEGQSFTIKIHFTLSCMSLTSEANPEAATPTNILDVCYPWAGCVACYYGFSEKSKLSNVELGYSTWMGDHGRGSSQSWAS